MLGYWRSVCVRDRFADDKGQASSGPNKIQGERREEDPMSGGNGSSSTCWFVWMIIRMIGCTDGMLVSARRQIR